MVSWPMLPDQRAAFLKAQGVKATGSKARLRWLGFTWCPEGTELETSYPTPTIKGVLAAPGWPQAEGRADS